jgi:predicted ATPase
VRTRILTFEQILGCLDDRFALLTGRYRVALPHHQTLRGAIDWSYDLVLVGTVSRHRVANGVPESPKFVVELAEVVCQLSYRGCIR